jgi:hypothetical protein
VITRKIYALDGAEAAAPTRSAEKLAARMPVLIIALGRGRVGKTATLNALIQRYRALECDLRIWNADQQNETHSLSRFHPDVVEPPPRAGLVDTKLWLEGNIQDQSRQQYDVVLDFAGGDPLIKKLAVEVRLVRMLERMGIRPVAMHVVGPEKADLDYLRQVSEEGLFMPEATLIVLNGGLVESGRSVDHAFVEVGEHPVILNAMKQGAEVVMMPPLACMSRIADLEISFADAACNRFKPGQEPLSFFDQERTAIWLETMLPKFFGAIPLHWMPRLPAKGS